MQATELQAGEQLDAEVARVVFGEPLMGCTDADLVPCGDHYSSSMSDAWEVVEKIRERDDILAVGVSTADGGWGCDVEYIRDDEAIGSIYEVAETAPLAICRAALKALANA